MWKVDIEIVLKKLNINVEYEMTTLYYTTSYKITEPLTVL